MRFEEGGIAGRSDEGAIIRILGNFVMGAVDLDPFDVGVVSDEARERFGDYEEE